MTIFSFLAMLFYIAAIIMESQASHIQAIYLLISGCFWLLMGLYMETWSKRK